MPQITESVSNFIDVVAGRLRDALTTLPENAVQVRWQTLAPGSANEDALWWSCGFSIDPESQFFAGAPRDTWKIVGRGEEDRFAMIERILQHAAADRFGAQVKCVGNGPSDAPPADWQSVSLTLELNGESHAPLHFALSPALLAALGGVEQEPEPDFPPVEAGANSVDMLMHVEIPVSVSLGRAQMRMKDVLALTGGSIVELEQELNADVEIRVNNCVIARGEVVAVDGNYGVRILHMVPGGTRFDPKKGGAAC